MNCTPKMGENSKFMLYIFKHDFENVSYQKPLKCDLKWMDGTMRVMCQDVVECWGKWLLKEIM